MDINSEVCFFDKVKELGFDDTAIQAFRDQGWTTLASFAFSSTYSPGQPDDTPLKDQVGKVLFGDNVSGAQMTRVRRLFYEAYVTFEATMKHRVEREDDGPVKKMPKLEHDQRLKA
eukprot:6358082-Amphidinium_carterae.1